MNASKRPKNLYEILMDDLVAKIKNQEFSYDRPFCTEKQLAEDYRVSNITAKRAIKELEQQGILYRKRGVGSFVSRQAWEKKPAPAQLSGSGASVFAFVSPFILSPGSVFSDMIQRMNNLLNFKMGFISPFVTSRLGKDIEKERETLTNLLGQGISGLLFYPQGNQLHLDILWQLAAKGVPVIILNKTDSTPFLHNVVCDNYAGQKALCRQLISLGHKKIAYVASPAADENTSVIERLGGFMGAMNDAGLPVLPECIRLDLDRNIDTNIHTATPSKLMRIHETVRELMEQGVTAIQCDNDGLAYYVMQYCTEKGIQVPQDLSITGFDGYKPDTSPNYHITSVYQDFSAIADEAGRIFLEHLDGTGSEVYKTSIETRLIPGRTVGPCKNS